MRYALSADRIDVKLDDEEQVVKIDRIPGVLSFYDYVGNAISFHKSLKEIKRESNNDELKNEIDELISKSSNMLIERVKKYLDLKLTHADLYNELVHGVERNSLRNLLASDIQLDSNIRTLKDVISSGIPVMSLGKIDDIRGMFETVKQNTDSKFSDLDMQYPRNAEEIEKRRNMILDRKMQKYGISKESAFYEYIRSRLEIGEELQISRIMADKNPRFLGIIEELINKNNSIIDTRYVHYNMLRTTGKGRPIENLKDPRGESYLSLIARMDKKTLGNSKKLFGFLLTKQYANIPQLLDEIDWDVEKTQKYDTEMIDISQNLDTEMNKSAKRTFKMKFENASKSIKDFAKIHKREIRVAALAGIAITGIALGLTLNKPSIENTQVITPIIETTLAQNTDAREERQFIANVWVTPEIETEVSEKPVIEVPITYNMDAQVKMSQEVAPDEMAVRYKGPLERSIDNMDEELISALANAARKGNSSIPGYIYNSFKVGNVEDGLSDKAFLVSVMREIDSGIGNVSYEGNSSAYSYQMYEMMKTVLQFEVAEALEEAGYENVDPESIIFYPSYNTDDSVKKYDILRKDDSSDKRILIARSDHIQRHGGEEWQCLDSAIRDMLTLRKTIEVVAPFEANYMKANATRGTYYSIQRLVNEKDLEIESIKEHRVKVVDERDER